MYKNIWQAAFASVAINWNFNTNESRVIVVLLRAHGREILDPLIQCITFIGFQLTRVTEIRTRRFPWTSERIRGSFFSFLLPPPLFFSIMYAYMLECLDCALRGGRQLWRRNLFTERSARMRNGQIYLHSLTRRGVLKYITGVAFSVLYWKRGGNGEMGFR